MSTVFFESTSELATLSNTFANIAGVDTDPATVDLIITDPASVSVTYTYAGGDITKVAIGKYTMDVVCSTAGTWTYEWMAAGPVTDAVAGTWEVQEVALGKLYCTVEMLKSRFKDTRTTDDLEYHAACFAASRALEQYCGRTFYRRTEIRTLIPGSARALRLPDFHDLVSVTTLKTDGGDGTYGTTWQASDYQLVTDDGTPNINAGPEPKPYVKILAVGGNSFSLAAGTARRDLVQITGVWGWPSVPWAIKQAAAIVAAETFKLKDSAGMVASGYDDFDTTMLGAEARRRFARFANPYRRHAFLVA